MFVKMDCCVCDAGIISVEHQGYSKVCTHFLSELTALQLQNEILFYVSADGGIKFYWRYAVKRFFSEFFFHSHAVTTDYFSRR